MSLIAIEDAMLHVRAEETDRHLVQLYLDAAEDSAVRFMGRSVYPDQAALDADVTAELAGENPIVVNPSITAACLLLAGHLYANREDVATGVSVTQMPMGSTFLLMPYRANMGV
ncbi:head-tail connector protein [Pseudomonas sp. G.S.17]|uniref:head-tail connector protein n=1 Tax=Pseudomonas sp. G.S.17 TaxID=3137451 RepID=UPI00311CDE96